MSANSIFISYGHRDMEPDNWLERLKLYLVPLRRQELVDVWDDSRIGAGSRWREEIKAATERATSAILLVGPAFLASEFIATQELPVLLASGSSRGMRIYPLIVGFCGYKLSALSDYQSFNDPDQPLEVLPRAEQNKVLNSVSATVDKDLRLSRPSDMAIASSVTSTRQAMRILAQELNTTWTTFSAQCRRRDDLKARIRARLKVREHLEFEKFFFRYFDKLDREEKFEFNQIREMTAGSLHDANQKMLSVIEEHPQALEEIPMLVNVRQHLVFWLNKYDRVFVKTPEMCLLYTGVEDGVPFPSGIDRQVQQWLQKHPKS
jgi:hypothetical protein